ncbi:hypothetical protein [Paenibacillus sp. MMO-177]|uniref:hypothetical protein n=1 Tax=Paenibacillus sp. MMO-177 TaxID=3081289 RepID=UPI003016668E
MSKWQASWITDPEFTDLHLHAAHKENAAFTDGEYSHQQHLMNRAYNSGDLRMGVIAELYGDRNLLLSTDNTWRFHRAGQFLSSDKTGYDTIDAPPGVRLVKQPKNAAHRSNDRLHFLWY